jgi:hypothetical protein
MVRHPLRRLGAAGNTGLNPKHLIVKAYKGLQRLGFRLRKSPLVTPR